MTKKKLLLEHLNNLGINKNDNILIYSKLSSFGIVDKNFTKLILQCLYNKIGSKGSIAMPLYTFERKKNHVYDKRKIYENPMTGLLNKEFFKNKKILRSNCPIHSHIGIGPNVDFFNISDPHTSFGGKSDFYYFHKKNFKLILLGCSPQEGATYLHHLEALFKVSYRKWIIIKKRILDRKSNKTRNFNVNFFATKNNKVKYDLNESFNKLAKLGANFINIKLKYGKSYSIPIKTLHKYGLILLKKNKKALLIK